ncbi:uncharacterized protein MYCFIDRAFT_177008 [Pseudocercospora fijiensis CIRAD86]|uniref:Uncharacterized protein n=1 Tax=Pseudocercospora fijiensis (strain CIRAD86) TaxID=383855 RepID=M2ZLR6_PSEFD|nr:uncharacterized protein MYCFIDRAFT_177008 [Pseudocercospora fijiensis CIRAD86]EME80019.1 hypothetical protein MYCFIDRAFT_177008 [Pseudocercospora fijiensis CIRAD86]
MLVPSRQELPRPEERGDLAELEEKAEQFRRRQQVKSAMTAFTEAPESHHHRQLELAAKAYDRRKLGRDAFLVLKSTMAQRRQQSEKAEAYNRRQLLKYPFDRMVQRTAQGLVKQVQGDVKGRRIEAWVDDVARSTGHYPVKPSAALTQPPLDDPAKLEEFGRMISNDMEEWSAKLNYYKTHRVPGGTIVRTRAELEAVLEVQNVKAHALRNPPQPKHIEFGLAIEETMQSIHERVRGLASRAWDAVSATISGLWR